LRLSLFAHAGGAEAAGGDTVLYDLAAGAAHVAPAAVEGDALRWTLDPGEGDAPGALLSRTVDLDPSTAWLMRCDRVDFRPGGVAYRHTHPGPGLRCLLFGSITIDSEGRVDRYGPGEAWFERGPDPVLATTSADEPSAFVRVLLLPVAFAGQRTIRYVDPADADKPKTQRATVFLEHELTAPGAAR
jgi:quercetin dioxygenase-like cupin family protein